MEHRAQFFGLAAKIMRDILVDNARKRVSAKDYRIRLTLNSPESGRLYLLNEGPPAEGEETPTFNLLFPSQTANNGSVLVKEKQQIQIPEQSWFQFDAEQGTEKIWLIWSENDVPELEAVKGFASAEGRFAELRIGATAKVALLRFEVRASCVEDGGV
jgi:hypothetical protein